MSFLELTDDGTGSPFFQDITGLHQDITGLYKGITGQYQDITGLYQDITGQYQDIICSAFHFWDPICTYSLAREMFI